jgi:hypothetical protein
MMLKMATFGPMPKAKATTAVKANPGERRICRSANRKFRSSLSRPTEAAILWRVLFARLGGLKRKQSVREVCSIVGTCAESEPPLSRARSVKRV